MGTINHDAVIATTWCEKSFKKAMEWIAARTDADYFLTQDGREVMNGYRTIVLIPDGSKEGWKDSEIGDSRRAEFIDFLKTHGYEDGSNPWDYCEPSFGEFGASIKSTNCKNCY